MKYPKTLRLAALGLALSAPIGAFAATLELNFGQLSNPSFGTNGTSVMSYSNVADGVNATLSTANMFTSANTASNGAVANDLRINLMGGQSSTLTLSLWDATSGSGYETAYDPGDDYDWTLGFYDIDGTRNRRHDVVSLLTQASYTLSGTSILAADTSDPSRVSFSISGDGAEVAGQDGLGTLTQEQADVAVLFSVANTSTISFEYAVGGVNNHRNGRNLLVDGGQLATALDPFDPVTETFNPNPVPNPAPIPLPATGLLLLGGLAAIGGLSKARK